MQNGDAIGDDGQLLLEFGTMTYDRFAKVTTVPQIHGGVVAIFVEIIGPAPQVGEPTLAIYYESILKSEDVS